MVNRNLIRSLENDDELTAEIEAAMANTDEGGLATAIETETTIDVNSIVEGKVIRIDETHSMSFNCLIFAEIDLGKIRFSF